MICPIPSHSLGRQNTATSSDVFGQDFLVLQQNESHGKTLMETTEKHSWKTTCSTTSLSITVLYYSTAVEFVLELNLPYYNLSLELLILPAKDEGN